MQVWKTEYPQSMIVHPNEAELDGSTYKLVWERKEVETLYVGKYEVNFADNHIVIGNYIISNVLLKEIYKRVNSGGMPEVKTGYRITVDNDSDTPFGYIETGIVYLNTSVGDYVAYTDAQDEICDIRKYIVKIERPTTQVALRHEELHGDEY